MTSHDVIICSVGLLSEGIIVPTVTVLVVLCLVAMTLLTVIVTIVTCWKIHKTRQKGKLLI